MTSPSSSSSTPPSTSTSTQTQERDSSLMLLALHQSSLALSMSEVPVGCVFVASDSDSSHFTPQSTSSPSSSSSSSSSSNINSKNAATNPYSNTNVIAYGHNLVNATRDPTRHAEIVAIDRFLTGGASSDLLKLNLPLPSAKSKVATIPPIWIAPPATIPHPSQLPTLSQIEKLDVLKRSTLYVTCEPCVMCASALLSLGVSCVVYGCRNEKFGGTGGLCDLSKSKSNTKTESGSGSGSGNGVTRGGVRSEEGVRMLRMFYGGENESAPVGKRRKKEGRGEKGGDGAEGLEGKSVVASD